MYCLYTGSCKARRFVIYREMKYFAVIIAILALLPQDEATSIDDFNTTVSALSEIKLSLELYKKNIPEEESLRLAAVMNAAQQTGIDVLIAAIDNWEDKQCKEILLKKAKVIMKMINEVLTKCFEENEPRWVTYAYQINQLITVGKDVEAKADFLKDYCSNSTDGLETCLNENVLFLMRMVAAYQKLAGEVRIKVQADVGMGFMLTGACLQRVTEDIFTEIRNRIDDNEVVECLTATGAPQLIESASLMKRSSFF
ncbi:uncharacterized protein [Fopius arisanus]|uniref:Uncharacterized protein n=2 Tax=Fopius arisanus TaxID=64838 RepID=A0A9R1TZ12_9HYME|nr:PREDICTED: uncharacterized protein LOC105266530 [Fopius arisanus]